jgi:hypothetical protein
MTTNDKLSNKQACQKAYDAYKKEWQMSEDAAPDYLVWQDAWNASKKHSNKDSV